MARKINLNAKKLELYNELKKQAKITNQRLARIEKATGKTSWAGSILKNKLDTIKLQAWSDTGRIKVNKTMSTTQMRAILADTERFLDMPTSTLRGIKKQIKATKQGIKKSLDEDFEDITDEDVEQLYSILEDPNVNDITDYIKASDLWSVIADEKQNKRVSKKRFQEKLLQYMDVENDENSRQMINEIYEKYVKRH